MESISFLFSVFECSPVAEKKTSLLLVLQSGITNFVLIFSLCLFHHCVSYHARQRFLLSDFLPALYSCDLVHFSDAA